MKGKMKKLVAFALAAIMVLAMGITVSAAEENNCSITIKNPATITSEDGKTKTPAEYTAFKIFDVHETTVGEGENARIVASYTRPADKPLLEGKTKEEKASTYFKIVNNGGEIYYTLKDGVTNAELEAYLGKVANTVTPNGALATATATKDTDYVMSGLTAGYYYVRSTAGNAAMIRTVAGNTDIAEKNRESGWGDNGGKKSYSYNEVTKDWEEDAFYKVGEYVKYEVTYAAAENFTTVTKTEGTTTTRTSEKVYQYKVVDTLPAGLQLVTDEEEYKLTITVTEADNKETVLTAAPKDTAKDGNYIDSTANNKIDITIPWAKTQDEIANEEAEQDFYYKSVPATIKVVYYAKVAENVEAGEKLTNTVTITPNNKTVTETDKETNDVFTGSIQVKKVDSSDADVMLGGAEFQIIRNATQDADGNYKYTLDNNTEYLVKADGTYKWVKKADLKATDVVVTLTTSDKTDEAAGTVKGYSEVINGLDKGTYYLIETKSPVGYNLMDSAVKVDVATLTKEQIKAQEDIINSTTASDEEKEAARAAISASLVKMPEIENSTGTLLPSTGGIGTTIFYVVGGILVVVAGVLLITKKRMGGRD